MQKPTRAAALPNAPRPWITIVLPPLLSALALAACTTAVHPSQEAPPAAPQPDAVHAHSQAVAAYERGDFAASAELARTSYSIATRALGDQTRVAAGALNMLASAELALGRYPEAAAAYEESLAILRQSSDPETEADIVPALGNLGELYRQQGQLERALPYYEESYLASKDLLGETHIATARPLAALALIRHQSGDLEQAEPDYATALELMADTDIPALSVARVRANQADLLMRTGRMAEARAALEDVLATEQVHLPAGHPDFAYTLNTLGVLADAQHRHDDALLHYRQALAIRQQALPPGHPASASVLANMAGTLAEMGNVEEARTQYTQAISLLRDAHGDDHPDIADYEDALRALD